jgi:hypothetical protein
MKQFIIKFICCGALVVAIDLGVGFTHSRIFGNLPDKTSMVSTIYYSLFKKSADVLILGSSTANHHYNSKMMEDSLRMSVYNSGLDGRDMIYFDVVLQSTLERQIPKYVILDISSVHLDGSWISRISDTKLYYGQNVPVSNYYDKETDWQQRLKLCSALYRYNKTFSYLIRVKLDAPNVLNGYAPLVGNRENVDLTYYSNFSLDTKELAHLENIIKICKRNNSILILVQSPQASDNLEFDKWIEEYASEQDISLIKENKNSYYFDNPSLFYDGSHLNSQGADILTKRIIEVIKHKIDNNCNN